VDLLCDVIWLALVDTPWMDRRAGALRHRYGHRYGTVAVTAPAGVPLAGSVAEERILDALTIELLGPPEVSVGGEPLTVDTRKAVALLAVLAVDGTQSRDLLATMLWPDSDSAHGRGALRRTLSVLNAGLGVDHHLQTDRMRVAITPAGTSIDVAQVEDLLRSTFDHGHREGATCSDCIQPLVDAAALHRGEFLDGFVVRGAPEFEEWRGQQAERLRRRLTRILDLLTRAAVDDGDLEITASHLQRWLAVDPLNEQVHGRLMLLHAWRGERTEAIRRYRECVAVLHRELGVAALPQTNRLYQAILEGRVERPERASSSSVTAAAMPTRPAPTPPPGPADRLAFVGRDREVQSLERQLGMGAGEILTVVGEAGVGRSALVEHVGERLKAGGRTLLFCRCRPGEHGIAYGALMDLLRTVLATPGALQRITELPTHQLSEATRLLPELAELRSDVPAAGQLGLPGGHARFLEAVARLLATAAEPPDVPVLIVEDVHTADSATLDVLTYAAYRLSTLGLSLVLTWRSDATLPPLTLQRCLADESVAPRVTTLVLDRLQPEDTQRLCASLLPDVRDPDRLARRIHDEAEGLPLAVVEYARELADSGLTLDDPWPVPAGLRELVRGRLAELSGTAQQLAGAAALFGARFDLDMLVAAAGRTEDETIAGLESLLACGLIEPGDDGSYGLTHEHVRNVVTTDLTPVRRRSLHGRIVDVLSPRTRRPNGNALAALVAEHARLAGRDEEAATWSVLAGDHARTVFAHADALRHYERALAASHPRPAEVHRRIAQLRVLNGEYRAGLQAYELAAAHADDARGLAVIEHELAALHLRRSDTDASRAHLTVALDLLDADDPLFARVLADVSLTELESGDLQAAAVAARRALAVAEASGDAHAIAQARNVAGIGARRRGDLREALRHLEHAAALATRLDDPSPHIAALNNLALTTADLQDPVRAEQLFERAIARCAEQGDRHRQAALLNNLADLLHTQGREEDSRARLTAAVTMFAEVGDEPRRHPEVWKLVQW
jgi:DNA-binding SARP family transcriptional activator/predicted ATPase